MKEKKWMILFVRHGQTNNNLKNNMNTGDDNDPLTEIGIAQAIAAGESLKESSTPIHIIISSNLDRAIDTWKYIWDQINFKWEYIVDSRLREQDWGAFKWVSREEIMEKYSISNNYHFRKIFRDKKYNKIESAEDFSKRVIKAYTEIKEKYIWKNVLIVWHSGTSRPLLSITQNLDIEYCLYEMPWIKNAQVIDLENYTIKK